MSSFVGEALLGHDNDVINPDDYAPPDEPGLGVCAKLDRAHSVVAYRCRIVTPEDRLERQPWSAWGGRGWVCFAGRLDDRRRLAHLLDMDSADGVPDGFLACQAVERWGEEALRRLLGSYALAAWDGEKRQLILAGDPTGMRTIYYCRRGDRVVFSTTIRGLLRLPMVSRAIDPQYVADFLSMNFGDDDATFYRDIRRIIPGTGLILTSGRARTVEFHRFDPERRLRLKNDNEYVEAAREILDQAVADRMRAVTPVPISASGGLDSACLAVSAQALGYPVTLLTAVPDPDVPAFMARGSYNDERPLVESLVAAFPGMCAEFHPPPADSDWGADIMWPLATVGIPLRNPSHVTWFDGVYKRAAALGAVSLMAGDVGNHTLTWHGLRSLLTLLRQGRLVRLARELVLTSAGHPRRMASLIIKQVLRPMLANHHRYNELHSISPLHAAALKELDVVARISQRANDPGFVFSGDSRQLRIHSLMRGRYRRADAMNLIRARWGLDIVTPLNDVRLTEFCLAIPDDQFMRDGTTRFLARRILRKAGVPAVIAENPIRGRQHPEWFAHLTKSSQTIPDQLNRLRRSPTVQRLIDLDRLDRLIAAWPADAAAAEREKVALLPLLNSALSVGAFIAWAEGSN